MIGGCGKRFGGSLNYSLFTTTWAVTKKPWLFAVQRGWKTSQLYGDWFVISHEIIIPDPYYPIRIQWNLNRVLNVAHLLSSWNSLIFVGWKKDWQFPLMKKPVGRRWTRLTIEQLPWRFVSAGQPEAFSFRMVPWMWQLRIIAFCWKSMSITGDKVLWRGHYMYAHFETFFFLWGHSHDSCNPAMLFCLSQ